MGHTFEDFDLASKYFLLLLQIKYKVHDTIFCMLVEDIKDIYWIGGYDSKQTSEEVDRTGIDFPVIFHEPVIFNELELIFKN